MNLFAKFSDEAKEQITLHTSLHTSILDCLRRMKPQVENCETARKLTPCEVDLLMRGALVAFLSESMILHQGQFHKDQHLDPQAMMFALGQKISQIFPAVLDDMSIPSSEYDS